MSVLAALITEVMEGGPRPEAVGIGCAGPLDLAAGTVSPVNMPSWRGFPLRDEVRKLTGLPTMLAGDAQCFALGEHWLGAGRGCPSLLGIVVSTGIGGGLVIDGAPLLGPTGNAGHVGHMSIDPYGERCECGGRGCVERYSSGPNMVRWALENGWSPTTDQPGPATRTGDPAIVSGNAAPSGAGRVASTGSRQTATSGSRGIAAGGYGDGDGFVVRAADLAAVGAEASRDTGGEVVRDARGEVTATSDVGTDQLMTAGAGDGSHPGPEEGVNGGRGTPAVADQDARASARDTTPAERADGGATERIETTERIEAADGGASERIETIDGEPTERAQTAEGGAVERVGVRPDARALAKDAAEGHPVAVAAFERGARALAGMIASTAAAAEVTTVVIGGGVSGAGEVLFDPLQRAFDDVAGLDFVRAVQIKQSTLGVRAGLAGAANLAWQAIQPTS